MTKPKAHEELARAYAHFRHPVWAWLHVHGEEKGGFGAPAKASRRKKGATSGTAAKDQAEESPLPFATIEAKAHRAFLDDKLRARLEAMQVPPPDPPGSGTRAALRADLESVRLGALRAQDWREARAAVMEMAKLCTPATLPANPEEEMPPDDRPLDAIVDEALEILGGWRSRRDAVTAAIRADRADDRGGDAAGGGGHGADLPALSSTTPLS